MKFLLFIFVSLPLAAFAQKHDYVWIIGDNNTPTTTSHGGAVIDFNQNPRAIYYDYRYLNMFTTNASICDSFGRLIAYSNGCDIAGTNDVKLTNGIGINQGEIYDKSCIQDKRGYPAGYQSALMLPIPDTSNYYSFFYKHTIYVRNASGSIIDLLVDQLRYASFTGTHEPQTGNVLEKDIVLIEDTLAAGSIVGVRHANGKDWWVVTVSLDGQTFYILKLSKQGVGAVHQQTIGIKTNWYGHSLGQMVFSPDGSKLYRTNTYDPILVYDFDRSTGRFTGFSTIPFTYGGDLEGELGCAVSPNGRYLYLGARRFLWQFDLQAPDISASQTLVCEWVQQYVSVIPTLFTQLQLGPDCKIYGLGGGDTRYYHIIHHPDRPGKACDAELNGLKLPTPSGASIPSFPNFRLGPIEQPGLPCSPLTATGSPGLSLLPPLSVFPNPARDYVRLVLNRPLDAPAQWTLFDALGRPAYTQALAPGDGDLQEAGLDGLAAGLYYWELRTIGKVGEAVTGKLVVLGR